MAYLFQLINIQTPFGPLVSDAIGLLIFGIIVLVWISVFDYMFGWLERKVVARVQGRHGPTMVGKWGLLQNLADFIKLFAKESIIPATANKYLFMFSLPIIAAITVFLVEILPFSPSVFGVDLSLGLLAVFVLLSFVPIIIFIAGWASGNKFSSIGAQRSVILLISYEIPIFVIIAALAIAAKGFSFIQIVNAQSGLWFGAMMPIGLIVFFIAMLAELERPPFDLKEADSELIAGWLTDVSAPYYGIVLFIDYTRVLLGSMLITILFLGGWLGPVLPPLAWLLIKIVAVALLIVFVRATMPRMRIDKILRLGWFYLIPLSIVNLVLVYLIVANVI